MYLYELQASSIDKELENTAQQIGQGGARGPQKSSGPMTDPDDPLGGQEQNEPDPGMMSEPGTEDLDVADAKKIDSYVVAKVKNHSYVTDYRHRGNSKIEPFKIIQLELDELNQLRQLVRNKISMSMFKDQFGMYADPTMKFFQDLISFVEDVIETKKMVVKNKPDRKSPDVKKASFKKQDEPKTKSGKVKKPNRGGK